MSHETSRALNPTVVYVDDEPRNLSLFEMSVPENWNVVCFESAVEALKGIKKINPSVIVSDQRMPNMSGLEFLEVSAELVPDAVRFVVTGQTDEEIIIELVRRAKIFDYVTKPWDSDDLVARLQKGIDLNTALRERDRLLLQLRETNDELGRKNQELLSMTVDLKRAKDEEINLRQEIEGLTHWQVAEALKRGGLTFPFKRDIACLTFDIIGSSKLADVYIENRLARSRVMLLFKEIVLQNGGLCESQGGDACYAHFGAFDDLAQPCNSALNTAREFRVKLRNLSAMHGVAVECGIAMHYVHDAVVDQDVIKATLSDGTTRTKKDIHTQSRQVDILHRMEKLVHDLPGTNLIMTKLFVEKLKAFDSKLVELGEVAFRGQDEKVSLLLLPSDMLTDGDVDRLKSELKQANERRSPIAA